MGSLSNLYISQSYQSLLHFSTDNSASAALTMLQDGVGQNLYTYVNTNGDLLTSHSISSSIIEATNLIIKDKIEVTGSIDINASVTASNAFIENDLIVSGTLYAFKIVTTTESASVIFSSGSNILGDTTADTQTLIGSIIISGSQSVTGSVSITGTITSPTITTINGRLNNIEAFTSSANSRLTNLESKSASVDISVSNLNDFTSSQNTKNSTLSSTTASLNQFTASANGRLNNLESKSASVDISIANINSFTASNGNASLNSYTASNDTKWTTLSNVTSSLIARTGSYATTGSNTFTGSQRISGSVYGNIIPLTIASQTASMDLSQGNFFTLTLANSVSTRLVATNVNQGQTINILITRHDILF